MGGHRRRRPLARRRQGEHSRYPSGAAGGRRGPPRTQRPSHSAMARAADRGGSGNHGNWHHHRHPQQDDSGQTPVIRRTSRIERNGRAPTAAPRRRPASERQLEPHGDEPVPAVHQPAGRDLAADGRDPAERACSHSSSCRCPRCRRSITRPSRCRPSIRARARRS